MRRGKVSISSRMKKGSNTRTKIYIYWVTTIWLNGRVTKRIRTLKSIVIKLEDDLASIGWWQMSALLVSTIDELEEKMRQQQHQLGVKDIRILQLEVQICELTAYI